MLRGLQFMLWVDSFNILGMKKFNLIPEDRFYSEFKPIKNHFVEDSSFDGAMFETYGQELEYIRSFDPKRIWTVIDGEGGKLAVVAGMRFVDRLGYLITEKNWETSEDEVVFEDSEDVEELELQN